MTDGSALLTLAVDFNGDDAALECVTYWVVSDLPLTATASENHRTVMVTSMLLKLRNFPVTVEMERKPLIIFPMATLLGVSMSA